MRKILFRTLCRFLFRTLLKKRLVRLFVVGLFHAFVDVTEMFLFSRIRGKKLFSILLSQTRLLFGTRPYFVSVLTRLHNTYMKGFRSPRGVGNFCVFSTFVIFREDLRPFGEYLDPPGEYLTPRGGINFRLFLLFFDGDNFLKRRVTLFPDIFMEFCHNKFGFLSL